MCPTCPAHLFLLDLATQVIYTDDDDDGDDGVWMMKLLVM
jgi:hypothetical protein